MTQQQVFQKQVTTKAVETIPPKAPFEEKTSIVSPTIANLLKGTPIFSSTIADLLNDTIPPMGPTGPPTIAPPPAPTPVEEQYEYAERRAFATTTTPTYYDLQTHDPKEILIIAEGDDHFVEVNRQIDADSPKVFAKGHLSFTAKGITRVWYQAVTGTGTIYIIVFKR